MAIQFEKSSGGIVYRKKGNNVEILLLKWLNSRNIEEYVIPKGHIEDGEIAKDTAIREIHEESGLQPKYLKIIKFLTKLNYTFTAGYLKHKPVINKDVYIFLIKYTGDRSPIVQKEERFIGYSWINIKYLTSIDLNIELINVIEQNKKFFT